MNRLTNILFALFTFFVFVSAPLFAQTTAGNQQLPDYTQWEKVNSHTDVAIVDTKEVRILHEIYHNTDLENLKRNTVSLIYNESDNLWLALNQEETGERNPDGSVSTKEAHFYFFENVNGKRVFVRDTTNLSEEEFASFLRERYKLEFGQ